MRIHSDTLTHDDLARAVRDADIVGVWIDSVSRHGSRKRNHALEVRLAAEPRKGRRPRNTGQHGAERAMFVAAATYDEHGAWIAQLYESDPRAIVGPYADREAFHTQTNNAYRIA